MMKRISLGSIFAVCFAFILFSVRADESNLTVDPAPGLTDTEAAESAANAPKIEFDNDEPADEGADEETDEESEPADEMEETEEENGRPENAVEAVSREIETAIEENSADDLLNLATEAKLSAESILDLTKVIAYCVEAEKKGLSAESLEYCRQLKMSSQLERGLALAKIFMNDDLSIDDLPNGWNVVRLMALEDLESAVQENSGLTLAQLAIGRLQMLPDGDPVKAVAALDAAIETAVEEDPEILVEALKFRAMLEDDNEKGTELLNRALTLSEENPSLLNLLATRLMETRRDEKALEIIDRALAGEPDNGTFKKTKSLILAALERYDEAKALFDESMAGREDDLIAKIEKGQFLASIGQNQEAIDHFTQLIEEIGPIPSLLYLRAAVYIQEKDYKKGLRDVNKALGIDSSFSEAIRLKAVIYIQEEKFADAVRLLEKLRSQDPEDEALVAQLAYTMAQNDDFAGGMKRLDALLEKKPESLPLLRGKADMFLMFGRWLEAIDVYEKILKDHPGDSGTLNNLSWLLATSPDDSVRDGEKALQLALLAAEKTNYRESYILSTLAAAYAELGQFDEARSWSEKAVVMAEKEKEERLDDLKNELESYRKNEPWRETPQKAGVSTEPPQTESGETDFF